MSYSARIEGPFVTEYGSPRVAAGLNSGSYGSG